MHKILKRDFSNLPIIIPRHIEQLNEIEQQINELDLSVIIKSTNIKLIIKQIYCWLIAMERLKIFL